MRLKTINRIHEKGITQKVRKGKTEYVHKKPVRKTCPICKKRFFTNVHSINNQKFCSAACKQSNTYWKHRERINLGRRLKTRFSVAGARQKITSPELIIKQSISQC